MTTVQLLFLFGASILCIFALIWFILESRPPKTQSRFHNPADRDRIMAMLARVTDQFSLTVYKTVYNITDEEIENEKKRRRRKRDEWDYARTTE